mmetsp:Transcript_35437/g.118478  ORF Transcript_35437/g.118478 Transcript_35437/m.118478 type:complete len:136 (+) Transcript_35437:507-914(+)
MAVSSSSYLEGGRTLVALWTIGSPLPLWLPTCLSAARQRGGEEEAARNRGGALAVAPFAPSAPPFPLPCSVLRLGGRHNIWHRSDPLAYPLSPLPAVAVAVARGAAALRRVSSGDGGGGGGGGDGEGGGGGGGGG